MVPGFLHPTTLSAFTSFSRTNIWVSKRESEWRRFRRCNVNRLCAVMKGTTTPESNASGSSVSNDDTSLRFYNTQTKRKEVFTTIEPNVVRFYSCGPTVYDFAHVGNFRAFLAYDVIKRWLRQRGYQVNHVLNLTDIDDKIITRMQELGCTLRQLTDKYTEAFFDDLKLLNVIPATHCPRATEYIDDIQELVQSLLDKDVAYLAEGSAYFSVNSFPQYGQLVDLNSRTDEIARVDSDSRAKRDPKDFALWKGWKPEDGDVKWESSVLGPGRPGWHIECSCMAMKILGEEIDIHGGGVDLTFPHHENEAAQCEAHSGKQYVRFWLHNGFVNINDEKMSKSLGNFRTLRDVVQKRIDARAFRYLVVTAQYRSSLAFTDDCLDAARSTVKRLDSLRQKIAEIKVGGGTDSQLNEVIEQARTEFEVAMNDDLNTPRAAAAMFSVVNAAEKLLKLNKLSSSDGEIVLDSLNYFDSVFGVNYEPDFEEEVEEEVVSIPSKIAALLDERNAARKMKDYQLADSLRDRIGSAGYAIVDTPSGAVLERKKS